MAKREQEPFEIASQERTVLSQLIDESGLASVQDASLARLSRRVKRQAARELAHGAPHGSRFALAAAAAVFVVASLFGLSLAPKGSSAPLAVSLNPDGSVQIAYADGRSPRHVMRSLDPASATGARLDRTRGHSAVVDEDPAPRPGTVVFYRVD